MIVTEVLPRTLESIDLNTDPETGRAWLRSRYRSDALALVRLNMIASVTGAAVGDDGTSNSLTGGADRVILGAIRAEADAVLVGASTVRVEGYVIPRTSALVIVTRTGDLGDPAWAASDSERVIVLCPSASEDIVRARVGDKATVLALPEEDLDLQTVLSALSERGLRRVVIEGGPQVASDAVAAGVVDEICLTIAPRVSAVSEPFLRTARMLPTEPVGHLVDDAGFSYLRLRIR